MIAAFAVLLYRYTGQRRLPVQVDAEHVLPVTVDSESILDDVVTQVRVTSPQPGRSTVAFGVPGDFELTLGPTGATYDSDLFDASTIKRMLGHWDVIIAADGGGPVSRLTVLTAEEQNMMLTEWNDTSTALPNNRCLHTAFHEQAEAAPDAIAVIDSREWTYHEIDERSDALGRRLVELGVSPGTVVGVCLPRSADLLIAVLAVLKSGAAYLPLDSSYPATRLAHMVRESGCDFCVSDAVAPEGTRRVAPDERGGGSLPDGDPDSLCYVIYTSGSTGTPKGIELRHRGVLNNLADLNNRYGIGPGDRVLALSSPSFDMSVYEFLGMSTAGGTVVVPTRPDPAHWVSLLAEHAVTVWNSAPSLLRLLLDRAEQDGLVLPSLRLAMLGGDWIPVTMPDRLRTIAPDVRFIALGGATESSIHSTLHEVTTTDPGWRSIPYGRPMANQETYILDDAGQPCPIGVPGQLHLAGIGLARGYRAQPALTAEKFVLWHHPQVGTRRLYRTGDLARYRPDGQIELLGRLDFQVKIHGVRIELGEIEAALRSLPGVREAIVTAHTDDTGDRRLVGYVVPHPQIDLRDALADRLPSHMIPAMFVGLDRLPLNTNGKIDRRALPAPVVASSAEQPCDPLESRIASIWCEVLGLSEVGRDQNFLALGGDSFKAVRAAQAIDPGLSALAVLRNPTVCGLADHLRAR
jgi:amino acid adenylation domain-containing protein